MNVLREVAEQPRRAMTEMRRNAVETALAMSGGHVAEAARLLGVHRTYMYPLMKRLGIEHRRRGVQLGLPQAEETP